MAARRRLGPMTGEPGKHFSPYKGPASFVLQDRGLFFGRDRDARRIIEMVQTRQISMIHAPSGSGKTSLLLARVVPSIDAAKFDAVYCRPGDRPGLSVRAATILRVFSPPGREAAALEAACAAIPGGGRPPGEQTLGALRDTYPVDNVSEVAHRAMVADTTECIPAALLEVKGAVPTAGVSMVARMLTLPNGMDLFHRYIRRLMRLVGRPEYGLARPEDLAAIPVSDTVHLLRSIDAGGAYHRKIDELLSGMDAEGDGSVDPAVDSVSGTLGDFFDRLDICVAGKGDGNAVLDLMPRILLVIDQFEEFYVLYGDVGADARGQRNLHDFALREAFFDELADVLDPGQSNRDRMVRLAVSIRDDYMARVNGLEARCGAFLPAQKSDVPMLSKADVADVVTRPARPFGFTYDDSVIRAIGDALAKENSFILPVELQIVCQRLWLDLHKDEGAEVREEHLVVYDPDGASAIAGVRAILDGYLSQTLDTLDEPKLMDALLVLSSMITFEGTKEPATLDRLTRQSLANKKIRQEVLDFLKRASIISQEALGNSGHLVEIRHDFLIEPIRRELQDQRAKNADWKAYKEAIDALSRNPNAALLRGQLHALWRYANLIDPEALRDWLARRLFAGAALARSLPEGDRRRDWMLTWARFVDEEGGTSAIGPKGDIPPVLQELLADVAANASRGAYLHSSLGNLVEACGFFPDAGGADALARIADPRSKAGEVRSLALEALMSLDDGGAGPGPITPIQRRVALSHLRSQSDDLARRALLALKYRLEADREAGGTAPVYGEEVGAEVLRLADKADAQRVREVAQELLLDVVRSGHATVPLQRRALEIVADDPQDERTRKLARDAAVWMKGAVAAVAEDGSPETWRLLARIRRDYGVAPGPGKTPPRLFWWSARDSDLWPDRTLQTLATGFGVAVLVGLLLLMIPGTPPTGLARIVYISVTAGASAVISYLAVRLLPPAQIFANRRAGLRSQLPGWAAISVLMAYLVNALALVAFESGYFLSNGAGFWISVMVLALAFFVVRPMAFLLTGVWRSRETGFGAESILITLVPLAILVLGARLGIDDGQATEAHSTFLGGPIAAGLGVAFLRHDSLPGDSGTIVSGGRRAALAGGAALSLIGLAALAIPMGFGGHFSMAPVGLPALFAGDRTEYRLVHDWGAIPVDLRIRQSLRLSPDETRSWREPVLFGPTIASETETFADFGRLEPGRYFLCGDLVGNCGAEAGEAVRGSRDFSSWRYYVDSFERVLSRPRSLGAGPFVPRGFTRVALRGGYLMQDGADDGETLRMLRDLIDNLDPAPHEAQLPAGLYLLTRDATFSDATGVLRLGAGSMVLLTGPVGGGVEAQEMRLVAAVTTSGMAVPRTIETLEQVPVSALRRIPPERAAEILPIVEAFLEMTHASARTFISMDDVARFLIRGGLADELAVLLAPAATGDAAEGHWFLSLNGLTDWGGGLFRGISMPSDDLSSDTAFARLDTGWTGVLSPDFCYRFRDLGTLLWLGAELDAALIERYREAVRGYMVALRDTSEGGPWSDPAALISAPVQNMAAGEICMEVPPPLPPGSVRIDTGLRAGAELAAGDGQPRLEFHSTDDIVLHILLEDGSTRRIDRDPNRGPHGRQYSEVYELDEAQAPPVALCVARYRYRTEDCLDFNTQLHMLAGSPMAAQEIAQFELLPEIRPGAAYNAEVSVPLPDDQLIFLNAEFYETFATQEVGEGDGALLVAAGLVTNDAVGDTATTYAPGSVFLSTEAGAIPVIPLLARPTLAGPGVLQGSLRSMTVPEFNARAEFLIEFAYASDAYGVSIDVANTDLRRALLLAESEALLELLTYAVDAAETATHVFLFEKKAYPVLMEQIEGRWFFGLRDEGETDEGFELFCTQTGVARLFLNLPTEELVDRAMELARAVRQDLSAVDALPSQALCNPAQLQVQSE